jgi:SAM-dependent methyltransferase
MTNSWRTFTILPIESKLRWDRDERDFLAKCGLLTIGVDFFRKAIELTLEQAKDTKVDFKIGDLTRLDFVQEPFDLVLDVGCLHGLDAAGRARYAQHVARLIRPGSKLLLWAFKHSTGFGIGATPNKIPQRLGEQFRLTRVEHGDGHVGRNAAWYWLERKSLQ